MDFAFFLLLILILSTLIHFIIIYFLFDVSKNEQIQEQKTSNAKLTILICARNEAQNLKNNIPFFCEQLYDGLQVVVVDHKSTDSTAEQLQLLANQFDQLEVVHCALDDKDLPGKRSALAEGLRHANGAYILLVDADCRPTSQTWAKQMVDRGQQTGSDVVLGIGAYEKENTLLNRYIQFETFHTALLYVSLAQYSIPYMGVGRNLLVKKDVLESRLRHAVVPGVLSGDDDLLIAHLSFIHKMTPELGSMARTLSKPKRSWLDYIKQKTRHVSTAPYYRSHVRWILELYHGNLLVFLVALFALLLSTYWMLALGIALGRYGVLMLMMMKRNKILKMDASLVFLPFMELLLVAVPGLGFFLNKYNKSNEWS